MIKLKTLISNKKSGINKKKEKKKMKEGLLLLQIVASV